MSTGTTAQATSQRDARQAHLTTGGFDTHDGHDDPCSAVEYCRFGRCRCGDEGADCGDDECVDLGTNNNHCGARDSPCTGGRLCTDGACSCPDDTTLCGDRCADLSSDPAHCGACDEPCAGTCENGVCQLDPDGGMPDGGDPDGGDPDGGTPDAGDDASP